MKKLALCIALAIVLFAFNANAYDRAGKFETGSGLGVSFGQGDTAFAATFGADYYFADFIAANLTFGVTTDGAVMYTVVPRLKFTFNLPVEGLEISPSIGAGPLFSDIFDMTWIAVIGDSLYYWFLDNHLGIGTEINLTLSGGQLWDLDQAFNVIWTVVNVYYRF